MCALVRSLDFIPPTLVLFFKDNFKSAVDLTAHRPVLFLCPTQYRELGARVKSNGNAQITPVLKSNSQGGGICGAGGGGRLLEIIRS